MLPCSGRSTMNAFLANLFGKTSATIKARKAPARSARLGLENLEGRQLMAFDIANLGAVAALDSPVYRATDAHVVENLEALQPMTFDIARDRLYIENFLDSPVYRATEHH